MTRSIDNSQDIIDSRDIIARIEELESDRDSIIAARDEAAEAAGTVADDEAEGRIDALTTASRALAATLPAAQAAIDEWATSDEAAELAALQALASEGEGYADDWHHGCALIRDSHFEDYAREFAEDIGAIKADAGWPYTCIDWEQAAEELRTDYSGIEFDGVTYWVR